MLNQLRFDMYTIFRSKKILITLLVSLLLLLLEPISRYSPSWDNRHIVSIVGGFGKNIFPILSMIIISVVFCSNEFATGYIKNTYSAVSKFKYVLSKTICLFLFAVLILGSSFLIEVIFNSYYDFGEMILSHKVIVWIELTNPGQNLLLAEDILVSMSGFLKMTILQIFGMVAIGLIVNVISLVCNQVVASIVALIYYFLGCQLLHNFINDIVWKIIGVRDTSRFIFCDYSLIDNVKLLYLNICRASVDSSLVIISAVYFFWLIVSFLLSWLAMCKKNF